MLKVQGKYLVETKYEIKDEAKNASLLGYGNGYFGIRASLEEFGDVFVQGTYIRGVFDKIVEIPQTFSTNEYVKKYYFDGQKLKEFEKEDSCINVCDFTTIRFFVNGKMFLPWEGKILSWKRYIDFETGGLVREVSWDDGEGNITNFTFEAICSFANNHVFFQTATVEKVNHDLKVEVEMGVDTLVKTNGQHKSIVEKAENTVEGVRILFFEGDYYNMRVALASRNEFENVNYLKVKEHDGVYSTKGIVKGNKATVRKVVYVVATPDVEDDSKLYDDAFKGLKKLKEYNKIKEAHLNRYLFDFEKIDIKTKGDKEFDVLLRYCNYQTLIGLDRYDAVHSFSAKNLTAEKYNQFVWWDAEILQLPIFLAAAPEYTKSVLLYRYKCFDKAKEIAKSLGCDGAKFAFCSSVDGAENVWIYARHPFLQIHSTADVGYGIINYYRHTLDDEFMSTKGLEMLIEINKYFISRMTFVNDRYEILNVTGTDEHHPYINNNAYTNYEVHFLLEETIKFINKYNYKKGIKYLEKFAKVKDLLYLPLCDNGLIPQFDGYFDLKPYLPITDKNSPGFQMKSNGLYHLSQIIKQPDVMNLFSYLNIDIPGDYAKNWKYYEKMCEASSSLTFPVHAMCSIDNENYDQFKEYIYSCLKIDVDDLHNGAYQGVHAGCIAGGYYNIYRGICGFKAYEDYLEVNPHFGTFLKEIEFNFVYHGIPMHVKMNDKKFIITSSSNDVVKLCYKGQMFDHEGRTIIENK